MMSMRTDWNRAGTVLFTLALVTAGAAADELKRRGMVGAQFSPMSAEQRQQLSVPAGKGLLIASVVPNTAAEAAGLAAQDVLLRINDSEISDPNALQKTLRQYYAGDALKLTIFRAGAEQIKELTLRERPRETSDDFDIVYGSAKVGGDRVRTILTKPKGGSKLPAVLFIQSLTAQSMDFPPQMANHPYRKLLTELTKAGFATLRTERVGVGDSEGAGALDGSFATDVATFRAALDALRGNDAVDPARIFIFAHGSGTAAAPLVARGGGTAGVAVFGAISRPPVESLMDALRGAWKLAMLKPDEVTENAKNAELFLTELIDHKLTPAQIYEKHPALRGKLNDVIQDDQYMVGRHYTFLQQIADAKVLDAWSAVKLPVVAIWGQCDFQTNRTDHEAIAQAVNRASPGAAKFVELPNTDHTFSKAEDQEESYLSGGNGGPFNPLIVERLIDWMRESGKAQ